MNAVDTSVVIAAFASWHEGHEQAVEVLAMGVRLPAHCALESYSVLTRLPPPHRIASTVARDFLLSRFTDPLLSIVPQEHLALLDRFVSEQITGGAVYDGLVALTASRYGAKLFSRDRRASRVYEALGIEYELVI